MEIIQLTCKIWRLDRTSRRNVLSYAISLLDADQRKALATYINEIV